MNGRARCCGPISAAHWAADALIASAYLAGDQYAPCPPCAQGGGELLQVTDRKVRTRHQQERLLDYQSHWRKIGARIVDWRLIERWMKGVMRREAEDELVAVRHALCHAVIGGNSIADIFDDDRLSRSSARRAAKMRPTMSAPPPVAVGTTMVNGRAGHSCEWADDESKPKAKVAAMAARRRY